MGRLHIPVTRRAAGARYSVRQPSRWLPPYHRDGFCTPASTCPSSPSAYCHPPWAWVQHLLTPARCAGAINGLHLPSDSAPSAARTGMLCLWERVGRFRDAVVGRGVDGRWVGRHCGVQFVIRGRCSCRAVREPLGEAADRRVGAHVRKPVHERDRKPNRGKPVSACRHALQRGAGLCRRACEGRGQPW